MQTAIATIHYPEERPAGACARPVVTIDAGAYAGARFYLSNESAAWDLAEGDRIRVRFHPEDQFAQRVIDSGGGDETAHMRAADA